MATTEHKEGRATVKVIYWHWKTLADGSHPFILQITKDRKSKRIATGLTLHPKYWNTDKKEVRKSYPEPGRDKLLKQLAAWEAKYSGAASELAEADEQHDAQDVAAKAIEERKAQRRVKLLAYCYALSAGYNKTGQAGNATVYRDLGNQLGKFVAAESGIAPPPSGRGKGQELAAWVAKHDIPLDRVNTAFCYEWEQTLRATGIKEITLSLRFRTLRAVLNQAIAAGFMKPEAYPFARTVAEKHKLQVGKFDVSTQKRAISREALRRLEILEPETERQQLAKAVFLFSFYARGINFVDLGQLRWKDLMEGEEAGQRLSYIRQKTKGKFSLKLPAPAVAIVEKYRPFTYNGSESHVFPILNTAKHQTAQQIKNRLHKVLGQVNSDLKELGQQAGFSIPLTTYVARHSFANTLRQGGTPISIISKALGHRSEAVTLVYVDDIDNKAVDDALDNIL